MKLTLLVLAAFFSLSASAAGSAKHDKADARGFLPATAKKGGSGVQVAFRIEGTAQPNVPVRVTVEFTGITAADGATASLAAEAPATLVGPSALALAPGQTGFASLLVTAPADGIHFVNVTTRQSGRPSFVSIPIKVGAGGMRLQKPGAEQTMPGGEKVLSLPSK